MVTALLILCSLAAAWNGGSAPQAQLCEESDRCSLPRNGKGERRIAGKASAQSGSVDDEGDNGCPPMEMWLGRIQFISILEKNLGVPHPGPFFGAECGRM